MGLRLLRFAHCADDPGPQPLRHASINGRQLFHLASAWPELQTAEIVGIYQATGQEKNQLAEDADDIIEAAGGFDAFRPAAMIFEFLPYGPFAHLAVGLGLRGPFLTISGDELAGPLALASALHDLRRGRCQYALVGGYRRKPGESWLLLLGHAEGPGVTSVVRYAHGAVPPCDEDLAAIESALGASARRLLQGDAAADPLALGQLAQALGAAQAGEATVLWRVSADGRGVLLGLGAEA